MNNWKEEDLAIVVGALSLMNTPPNLHDVAGLASSLFGVDKASARWARDFLVRHGLKVRKAKQLTHARGDSVRILDDCATFAHSLALYYGRYGNPPAFCVFNADETLLTTNSAGTTIESGRVFPCFYRGRPGLMHSRSTTIGSLLSFVNAAGELFLSVFVLKSGSGKAREKPREDDGGDGDGEGDGGDDEQYEMYLPCLPEEWSKRDDGRVLFYFNRTGYVDEDIFRSVMEHFAQLWVRRCAAIDRVDESGDPKLRALVFPDNLGAHHTLRTVEQAMLQNIWLWPLPPNTSHFSQPLDGAPFGSFKRMLRRKAADYMFSKEIAGMEYSARDELARAAFSSLEEAFTADVIRKAFDETSIFPFVERKFMLAATMATKHFDEVDMDRVEGLTAKLAEYYEKKVREIAEREGREVARPRTKKKVWTSPNVAWTPKRMVEEKKKAKEAEERDAEELVQKRARKVAKRVEKEREKAEKRRDREVKRRQRMLEEELEQERKEGAKKERLEKRAQREKETVERKRAREEKREAKEHAKRQKMQEKEAKDQEVALRRCQMSVGDGERCSVTQKGAGKGWTVCDRCEWRLCRRHSTRDNVEVIFGQHMDDHEDEEMNPEELDNLLEELQREKSQKK